MDNIFNIDYSISKQIDQKILEENKIIPIKKEALFIKVACLKDHISQEELLKIFNYPVKPIFVSKEFIDYELSNLQRNITLYSLAQNGLNGKNKNQSDPNITAFLDYILKYCTQNGISDIHVEIMDKNTVIRIRSHGVLKNFFSFEKNLFYLLSSNIKLLGNLDISQKRLPQNSRFSKSFDDKEYDFRISTLPTIYGESIVLRVLDNKNIKKELREIGFKQTTLETIKDILLLNQGLILVTGPTGSGKTTTLYSMIEYINSEEKKIITIEDPVEYKLKGVIQVNINPDINLDYPTVLKNILRQDPDILMIGEIRDKESLDIAVRAALTGHLVIATLHTNDTIETVSRLLDLGAKSYLISTTLKLIISQRLVRSLCENCKVLDKELNEYVPKGCKKCNLSGFSDRKVIEEVLKIDDTVKNYIRDKSNLSKILEYAKTKDFKTLQQNGWDLVKKGITSQKEMKSKI